jgi:hypothetical protein
MILFSIPSAGGNTMGNFIDNTLLSLARDPDLLLGPASADRGER